MYSERHPFLVHWACTSGAFYGGAPGCVKALRLMYAASEEQPVQTMALRAGSIDIIRVQYIGRKN